MEQEYKLKGRYEDDVLFKEVRPNVYKLICKHADYMRFGLFNNVRNCYSFVDPPGGPFMRVGYYTLDGKVLLKINAEGQDILLTFGDYEELYHEHAKNLNKIITDTILRYAFNYDLEFSTLAYNMSTTDDSLRKGEWLPDTDACLEIKNSEGKTIGFNT